jgi:hypothetical protein
MYSLRVCSTNDRDLPPPELGPGLSWDRLTEVLARGISPEAAGLLAEPIHDELRGQTHWHITSQDDPQPVGTLSEAEQRLLLGRLDALRQEILQFAARTEAEGGDPNLRLAAALRAILSVPDEAHIWSADGKPVLTAWGRSTDALKAPAKDRFVKSRSGSGSLGDGLDAATIVGSSNRPIEKPSLAGTASGAAPGLSSIGFGGASSAAAGSGTAQTAAPTSAGPRWPAALLWVLFAVLVGFAYYMLLPACGLNLPFLSHLSDQCRFAGRSDLAAERAKTASLRDAIAAAELAVAETRGACAAQKDSRLETPPSVKDAEQRVQQANVSSEGKFEITLVWNGREDLDLHVFCADGHIFYGSRTGCGGTLDIDRNSKKSEAIESPVEHVVWQDDPPPGDYRVEVVLFDRFELPPRTIPFNVIIRDSTGQREYKGQIQQVRTAMQVAAFHR